MNDPIPDNSTVSLSMEVAGAIKKWQKALLDLSSRNTLIDFPMSSSHTLMMEPLDSPRTDSSQTLFTRLRFNTPLQCSFETEKKDRECIGADIRIAAFTKHPEQVITYLRLKTRSIAEDMGIHALFAGFGLLSWTEPGEIEKKELRSPLLLFPVRIDRISQRRFEISPEGGDESIILNPALTLKLEGYGMTLPVPCFSDPPVAGDLSQYYEICSERLRSMGVTFDIHDKVFLSLFSFDRIQMYFDLQNSLSQAIENPIIKNLVMNKPMYPAKISERYDNREEEYRILHADSSQREALESIQNGLSAVVQGPPGTGKSQTIANAIAQALADNKSVLFVSEKAAAAGVVKKRLDNAGLGHLCLDLHSLGMNKKKVIEELYTCFKNRRCRTSSERDETKNKTLKQIEVSFEENVKQLHIIREPWGKSLYQVLEKLIQLREETELPFSLSVYGMTPQRWDRWQFLIRSIGKFEKIIHHYRSLPWKYLKNKVHKQGYEDELTWTIDSMQKQTCKMLELSSALENCCPADMKKINDFLSRYQTSFFELPFRETITAYNARRKKSVFSKLLPVHRPLKIVEKICKETSISEERILEDLESAEYLKNKIGGKVMGLLTNGNAETNVFLSAYSHVDEALPGWIPLDRSLREIGGLLENAIKTLPLLSEFLWFEQYRENIRQEGLAPFVNYLLSENTPHEPPDIDGFQWETRIEKSVYSKMMEEMCDERAELKPLLCSREEYDSTLNQYLNLYEAQRLSASERILNKRNPKTLFQKSEASLPRNSEPWLLVNQVKKQKNHMSFRSFFFEIKNLLLELKPCLMMSPLTVSEYLKSGAFSFDLVVFDEASQIRPEEAMGAIIRAKQVVIAGDDQQLPPTNFFRLISEGIDVDEEENRIIDYESILSLSKAVLPTYTLKWHYRSQHKALIDFSNDNFYKGRLNTFPEASDTVKENGLDFCYVGEGLYGWGTSRINSAEAERVESLVFELIENKYESSLGVITFNESQQTAVYDRIEKRRDNEEEKILSLRREVETMRNELHQKEEELTALTEKKKRYDDFFDENRGEAFFVKNIERVQGDERDSIVLDLGYTKKENGELPLQFGPILQEGGYRRLNVAITRARKKLTLVSSLLESDFPSKCANPNVDFLKSYIRYVRSGGKNELSKPAFPEMATGSGVTNGSILLRDIANTLEKKIEKENTRRVSGTGPSCRVEFLLRSEAPVTDSNFNPVELAISSQVSGEKRYLIGIRTDRDHRGYLDALNDQECIKRNLLKRFGWKEIVTVRCVDWFRYPEKEAERIMNTLRSCLREIYPECLPAVKYPMPVFYSAEKETTEESTENKLQKDIRLEKNPVLYPEWVVAYHTAKRQRIKELLDRHELKEAVMAIVNEESPIHEDILFRYLQSENVKKPVLKSVLKKLTSTGEIKKTNENFMFLKSMSLGSTITKIRRSTQEVKEWRSIEKIAGEEIRAALLLSVTEFYSMPREDICRYVSEMFGFGNMGFQIRERITKQIDVLLSQKLLFERENRVELSVKKSP